MVSAGTVGLLKAARAFDAAHGAQFKTYAYIRIKGAMLDELRSASMLPSGLNRQVKDAMELSQRIATERGTAPSDAELADRLGITTDDLAGLYESARAQHFVSLDSAEGEETPSLLGSLAATNHTDDAGYQDVQSRECGDAIGTPCSCFKAEFTLLPPVVV